MKRIALLMGAALVWPFAANAELNYNYIQADWIADAEVDVESLGNGDADGISLEGSGDLAGVMPGLFVFGESISMEAQDDLSPIHFDSLSLGFGYRATLTAQSGSQLDVYGTASLEEIEAVGDNLGYGVGAGLRWLLIPGLEIKPDVRWVDYGGGSYLGGADADIDGWRYGVSGAFNLSDKVALTLGWTTFKLEADVPGDKLDVDLEDILRVGFRLNL